MDAEGLYRQQWQRVVAACRAMLGDAAAAEDAAQEVFLRVVPRLDALSGDPRAYLIAVARNVCRDELSRRAARAAVDIDGVAEVSDRGSAMAQQVVDRDALDSALRGLAAVDRELLGWAAAGLTLREMGERTGLAPLTAGQRISRARRRLRAQLERVPALVLTPLALPMRRVAQTLDDLATRMRAAEIALAPLVAAVVAAQISLPAAPPRAGGPAAAGSARAGDAAAPAPVAVAAVPRAAAASRSLAQATPISAAGTAARSSAAPPASPSASGAADDSVTEITASPSYDQDHTVFASAPRVASCGGVSCSPLLRSSDGGRTWQRLPAVGFDGGRILLSARYPGTAALLANGVGGVQRSDDGGASFTTAIPGATLLALDPRADRAVLSLRDTSQLLFYDIPSGHTAAGPSLPPGLEPVTVAVSTAGEIVVAAMDVNHHKAMVACSDVACVTLSAIPDAANPNLMVVSPAFATDRTLLLTTTDGVGLFVSHDGGNTLQQLGVRLDSMAGTLHLVPTGTATPRIDVVTGGADWRGVPARLLESTDGGAGFHALPARLSQSSMWLIEVVWLPDGRLLVPLTPSLAQPAPVACSDDMGGTWQAPC